MPQEATACGKSLARMAAGRRNRQLSGPLTERGRQRLRDAALRNQPWRFSTGPRTFEGKARAAMNGRCHQPDPVSLRQLRAGIAGFGGLVSQMAQLRQQLMNRRSD